MPKHQTRAEAEALEAQLAAEIFQPSPAQARALAAYVQAAVIPSPMTAGHQAALTEALAAAVPAWIDAIANTSAATLAVLRGGLGAIGPHGDQSWATDQAFDALARSLALDAYRPGGVTYLGMHWEAERPGPLGAVTDVATEPGTL